MPLSGLISVDGRITRSPEEMLDSIASEWAPIFALPQTDRRLATEFCSRWVNEIDMAGASPPDVVLVIEVLAASKHSALGPDGLPFSTLQRAGLAGSTCPFSPGVHGELVGLHPQGGGRGA